MAFDPVAAPVDYVLLAGSRSPGIATIDGASSPRSWDERRGYGLSGATLVYKGLKLAKFTLELKLVTSEDFAAWDSWRPIVQRPPAGQRPRALDIEHPITEMLGIRSVVVEDVLQPKQTGDGEWTIEIKLLEFRAPARAVVRPEGSADRPPAVPDAGDQLLGAAVAEFERVSRAGQQPSATSGLLGGMVQALGRGEQ